MASNRRLILLALFAVAMLAAIPLGLPLIVDVDGDDLSRDIADTAMVPWWTGAISFAGMMLWAAGAGACGLAAAIFWGRQVERTRFFAATAALLVLAALDDALQLHETVGPEKLGIPEEVCYLALLLAAVAWAVRFRRQILASRVWLLGLVAIFFFGSVLSDTLVIGPTAAEDWLKNSGIAILLIWCIDTALLATVRVELESLSELRPRREQAAATPPPAR